MGVREGRAAPRTLGELEAGVSSAGVRVSLGRGGRLHAHGKNLRWKRRAGGLAPSSANPKDASTSSTSGASPATAWGDDMGHTEGNDRDPSGSVGF